MAFMKALQDKFSSFTYEITDNVNFEEKELYTYKDLVEHVKSENLRLLMENASGQVTITKVERSLYAKAYFGKRFSLPESESTDWNKELAPFKTKRPIPFTIEKLKEKKPKFKEVPTTPVEISEEPIAPDEEVEVESETTEQPVYAQPEPINPFESDVVELNELPLEEVAPSITLTSIIDKYEELDTPDELLEKPKITALPTTGKKDFSEFINNFKSQGLNQISQFVKSKNQEMYEQIRQLDHRAEIREEVTADYNQKYALKKQQISSECQSELDKQINAEKIRHEQALQNIKSTIETEQTTRISKLKDKLILAKEDEITRRFNKETEALANALNNKKVEAQLQQEQLKSELQAFLDKALREAQTSQQTLDSKLSELNVSIPDIKVEEVEHEVVERQRVEEDSEIKAYS